MYTYSHLYSASKIIEGAGDDFNALLLVYRKCEETSDVRRFCRDHYLHYRSIAAGMWNYIYIYI